MSSAGKGHRERLRDRYLQAGIRGFSDRDALQLLLTYAIPRKDTKLLAEELLSRFGSLGGVLNQSHDMLMSVPGIGKAASVLLNLSTSITARALQPKSGTVIIDSPSAVSDYLKVKMGNLRKERLVALLLDSGNRLISECVLEFGTVDRATVHPRNLLEKVIATGSTAIILVHNHPGGALRASAEDIRLTRKLREMGEELGFRLLDHIIVAGGDVMSLREEGLLN